MDNNRQIVKIVQSIVKIDADNSNSESRRLKPDEFYGLKKSLFLATGSNIVLEINLFPEQCCSSDSIEVVKYIVYEEGALSAQKLPKLFWVEIDNYAVLWVA